MLTLYRAFIKAAVAHLVLYGTFQKFPIFSLLPTIANYLLEAAPSTEVLPSIVLQGVAAVPATGITSDTSVAEKGAMDRNI